MVTAAQAAQLREIQQGVTTLLERDLEAFFDSLDLARPEAARDALLAFVPELIREYGLAGATAAADWYDRVRADEGKAGRFRSRSAEFLADLDTRVESTVRRSAGYLFVEGTAALALPSIVDPTTKYALEPPRLTVVRSAVADPQARGWQRVARADACDFCRLLTGRGAVYSESSVTFDAHGHCHCIAAPAF